MSPYTPEICYTALSAPMDPNENDAKASTVREYLVRLLAELWREGENFSSKRPFGNSGWEWDLVKPLYAVGLLDDQEIEIDEEGYVENMSREAEQYYYGLVYSAIVYLNRI